MKNSSLFHLYSERARGGRTAAAASAQQAFLFNCAFLAAGEKKRRIKKERRRTELLFPNPFLSLSAVGFDTFSGNRHVLVSVPTTLSFNLSIDDGRE